MPTDDALRELLDAQGSEFRVNLARVLREPLVAWATALAVLDRHAPRDSHEARARESARRATATLGQIARLVEPWTGQVEVLLPVETSEPRTTRVLIVEDNYDLRNVLADLCGIWGHEVLVAGDGLTGVASALDHPPDVALIDINLPDIDGCEVARRIRADARGAGILLVALTAYCSTEQRTAATAAGFNLYVLKSADVAEVIAAITAARQTM